MRITQEIEAEAQRLIRRHERGARELFDEWRRRDRRSTRSVTRISSQQPGHWDLDRGFDPYLVRSRASSIGHSVSGQLSGLAYRPRHPIEFQVPKPSGGTRTVSIFQIADSAVSRSVYESLLEKNRPLLSARSYAYRKDLSTQDAIQYVKAEVRNERRLFIAEYDFRSYFDNIDHDHILRVMHDNDLLATDVEKCVVLSFLRTAPLAPDAYTPATSRVRERGIPQGTSISLFLANLAAWEIDKQLEKIGVGFVRYADDTLIWSTDYSSVCRAVDALQRGADAMGVEINLKKSNGVRLLTPEDAPAEIERADFVDFLGYRLTTQKAEIKPESIEKIKARLRTLMYRNLLYEPLRATQDLTRLARNVDRDYVTFLWQARRYMYGDLSERAVQRFQSHYIPLRRFKGVMAAYPLADDTDVLAELDGWLSAEAWLALRKRGQLLAALGLSSLPTPHGVTREALVGLRVKGSTSRQSVDLRIPSFRRIAKVMRRAAAFHGAAAIGRSKAYDY